MLDSEAHFHSACEMSPDGIFVTDAQGAGVYTNRRWQEMVGLSLEASLSTEWSLAVHPDDRGVRVAGWSREALEDREYEAEFRIQHPSGRVRWVQSRSRPLYHANGEIRGHVGTVQDITDRKRMEQRMAVQYAAGRAMSEAREQEAGLALILEQVGAALSAHTAGLWIPNAETGLLQCRSFWSASPTIYGPFEARSRSLSFQVGEVSRAASSRRTTPPGFRRSPSMPTCRAKRRPHAVGYSRRSRFLSAQAAPHWESWSFCGPVSENVMRLCS